ncbi:MAG: amidohydrolase family protein [Bacteroidota bacterium]|nr:amidohydrolase family protein [Bacteroidota bacterium]
MVMQRLTAQETFPSSGEISQRKPDVYALTNARIIVSPTITIESGTVLIREGMIEAVGMKLPLPSDAIVYDMQGKTIYPSFIDMDSDYGMPAPAATPTTPPSRFTPPQYTSKTQGAYAWNEALKPEKQAHTMFVANPKAADELRRLGFGAVLTFQHDGIARGSAALVSLGDGKENTLVLRDRAAAMFSLNPGSSRQEYPSSLMGVIALLRQTYLDAAWYKQARAQNPITTEFNISLEAWNALQNLPQIMDVSGNRLNLFRADRIGDEAGIQYILRAYGDEYAYVEDIKRLQAPLITSLNFPLPYALDDPLDALNVSLMEMKHWELAPTNPAMLEKAGITFALTTSGLRSKSDFFPNLRTAITYGLSKRQALAALTTIPAQLLNVADKLGTIEKGKIANLLVTSGDIFDAETVIYQNWVQGKPYELYNPAHTDIRGSYTLSLVGVGDYTLTVKGSLQAPQLELTNQNDTTKTSVALERSAGGNAITLRFPRSASTKADITLSGWIDAQTQGSMWSGKGQDETGAWFTWSAKRIKAYEAPPPKPDTTNPVARLGQRFFPAVEYGVPSLPKQESVLIKNATVWTCEKEGILRNTDILVKRGTIAAIGKNLHDAEARIIDATGKHVSPGIVDEHSHIALQSINESGQSVTCEVRVGDVINPEDVNIYRQLAGGVTTSHLLHGSANSIGGQTQLIKMRWGLNAEQLKFEGAPGFVKFALGENVKQSNWGDAYNQRFPQTRMGVEQVMIDAFNRAREYEAVWKAFRTKPSTQGIIPPRRDLELEALVEVLNGKRFITCHSYVQSEITMLMRVAEQFGFKVNTFTHILEGYKVADKMKAHGAHASSFSDWWAYKMEVADAIPYNGALLHAIGINVGFNSDDAEMARRLNQEAAKAVKYGGVPEEEALKFVTLNPAKMLHIDHRVGSLKVGKDADLVIWSDNPLSIYARVEQTFVDGVLYYDRARDAALRETIRQERARLTQAMLRAKKSGIPTQPVPPQRTMGKIHCHTLGETGW